MEMREKILISTIVILMAMLIIDNVKLNKQYEIVKTQQETIEELTSKLVGAGEDITKEEMVLLYEANEKYQKLGEIEK
jgi:uncharacterized membrane protein YgaE (UPF0421/DUF939 family)